MIIFQHALDVGIKVCESTKMATYSNSLSHKIDNDEPYTASRIPRPDSIDARAVG